MSKYLPKSLGGPIPFLPPPPPPPKCSPGQLFIADETKTQSKTKDAISTIEEAVETEGLSSSVLNSLIQFVVGGTGDGSKYMHHPLWVGGRQGGCIHSIY